MDQSEYHSSTNSFSRTLPTQRILRYRKLTFGVWLRRTVDRPLRDNKTDSAWHFGFKYEPLAHPRSTIRLLDLEPGLPDEPLRGNLIQHSLRNSTTYSNYESLSYCWGNPTFSEEIEINGTSFRITDSLCSALSSLRSPTKSKLLWIDAICINQSDMQEKSHQIQLMTQIYASAARVLVWLGPSSEHSGVGMSVLEDFLDTTTPDALSKWRALPPYLVKKGLEDIMQRYWFSRYWVVQEAAVAQRILMVCGSHTISWTNACSTVLGFQKAIKLAIIHPEWETVGLDKVDMDVLLGMLQMQLESGPEARIWAQRPQGPNLLEFAYSMRHRKATNPRDRIYALLGLVGTAYPADQIIPDYNISLEELHEQFAAFVTKETDKLCAELALKANELNTHDQQEKIPDAINLDSAATSNSLDVLIERACAQAILDVRNNNLWKAAQDLQNAAMLLRGESYGIKF